MQNDRLPYLREKTLQLPMLPGIYKMKNKAGEIIYIGKAKLLRNRVSSYFRGVERHTPKVYKMVEKVYDFDYIVTESEFEALVLECSLIKEYSPKYNILLKDDKGYFYVKVTQGDWGRITAVKQKLDDDALYLGPYTSNYIVRETVDEANKVFRLPTCNRKFPQDFGKGRPCLNYHIQQCMGVCRGKISKEEYQEALAQALEFIRTGGESSLRVLTQQMEQAAEALNFEKAARYRDRINAIRRVHERQRIILDRVEDQDMMAFVRDDSRVCAAVLKFRESRLQDKEDFLLGETMELPQVRRDFLLQYYGNGRDIPKLIGLDGPCEEQELVEQYLTGLARRKVSIRIPQRGDKSHLVELASTNAAQRLALESQSRRTVREVAALEELSRLLGLPKPPKYIEAYDISNIGSATVVAGMVVFEDGKPLKSAYKRFTIKTVEGTDDYASMAEVLTRRLERYRQEEGTDSTFARLPDLILLDGGKGHVATIEPLIRSMGFAIPVFGMVKDDRHRTRAIAKDGGEIAIASNRSAFTLVSAIQEEVHRYAITYARSKHKRGALSLALTQVPGIGPAKSKALFAQFKTLKAMGEATVQELAQIKGMSEPLAQRVYDFLHAGQS